MLVIVVLLQIVLVVEVLIAEATVMVAWTLNVVLSQRPFRAVHLLAVFASVPMDLPIVLVQPLLGLEYLGNNKRLQYCDIQALDY